MVINIKSLGKLAGRAMKKAQAGKTKTRDNTPGMADATKAKIKAAAKKVRPRLAFKDGGSVKNRSKSSCK